MFDFAKIMAAKSDPELLEIVNENNKYQDEAIAAAKNELKSRNLSVAQLEAVTQVYTENKAIDDSITNAPLELRWKILTFIFPMIFTVILSGYLTSGGYVRKSKELATWTFYGFGFYIALLLLMYIMGA